MALRERDGPLSVLDGLLREASRSGGVALVLAVSIRRFFGGVLQTAGAVPDQNLFDALTPELGHLLA